MPLLVCSGKAEHNTIFACSLYHPAAIKSAEEAVQLMVTKRLLFRDWIDKIALIGDNKVFGLVLLKDGNIISSVI